MNNEIKKIVVLGADVFGLSTALYLSKQLNGMGLELQVVDCPLEQSHQVISTHPSAHVFFQALGLDMRQLMAATDATFNLGFDFIGWQSPSSQAFVPFTSPPSIAAFFDFHQFWLKARKEGKAEWLDDYSLAAQAAKGGKFAFPSQQNAHPLTQMAFGINMDSQKLLAVLQGLVANNSGITIKQGSVEKINHNNGLVSDVQLNNETITADFFIDCCGQLSQIMPQQKLLENHGLPCDRMYRALFKRNESTLKPLVELKALPHGWLKQSELQSITELIFVYKQQQIDDDTAQKGMIENMHQAAVEDGFEDLAVGRVTTGWHQNSLVLGHAALQLAPLEMSEFALLINDLNRFIELFPESKQSLKSEEYNRLTNQSHDLLLDHQILRLGKSAPFQTAFWSAANQLPLSEKMQQLLALFQTHGRLPEHIQNELITKHQWALALLSFGILPANYHPLIEEVTQTDVLQQIRLEVSQLCDAMPTHEMFLQQFCQH